MRTIRNLVVATDDFCRAGRMDHASAPSAKAIWMIFTGSHSL